jgi:hypothetical protein
MLTPAPSPAPQRDAFTAASAVFQERDAAGMEREEALQRFVDAPKMAIRAALTSARAKRRGA